MKIKCVRKKKKEPLKKLPVNLEKRKEKHLQYIFSLTQDNKLLLVMKVSVQNEI